MSEGDDAWDGNVTAPRTAKNALKRRDDWDETVQQHTVQRQTFIDNGIPIGLSAVFD